MELSRKKSIAQLFIHGVFLLVLNIVFMSITGFLTLDSAANVNSRIGAYLLSFFLPFFIVFITPKMDGMERMLKFGTGYIFYIVLALIMVKFGAVMRSGLLPCLLVSLAVLFYGEALLKSPGKQGGE